MNIINLDAKRKQMNKQKRTILLKRLYTCLTSLFTSKVIQYTSPLTNQQWEIVTLPNKLIASCNTLSIMTEGYNFKDIQIRISDFEIILLDYLTNHNMTISEYSKKVKERKTIQYF
jgi:hypothetical protein